MAQRCNSSRTWPKVIATGQTQHKRARSGQIQSQTVKKEERKGVIEDLKGDAGRCKGDMGPKWAGDLPGTCLPALALTLHLGPLGVCRTPAAGTPKKAAVALRILRVVTAPIPRVFWFVMGPGLPGTKVWRRLPFFRSEWGSPVV